MNRKVNGSVEIEKNSGGIVIDNSEACAEKTLRKSKQTKGEKLAEEHNITVPVVVQWQA